MSSSHSDAIAKLQAEKLAAEEKKKQSERQMKDEMERMKNNLMLRVIAYPLNAYI
jgi:hypothetical protein